MRPLAYLNDCRVQTKQKCSAPKSKVTQRTHLYKKRSHYHVVCLLLVIKIKTCTYQLCKRQSAARYQRRPILNVGASLVIFLICATALTLTILLEVFTIDII